MKENDFLQIQAHIHHILIEREEKIPIAKYFQILQNNYDMTNEELNLK